MMITITISASFWKDSIIRRPMSQSFPKVAEKIEWSVIQMRVIDYLNKMSVSCPLACDDKSINSRHLFLKKNYKKVVIT